MNWRKDLLARQATFDSLVLAVCMYLAGLLMLASFVESDVWALLVSGFLSGIAARKGWRLWHALHRLARTV